jgi:hypothetical protein
MSRHLRWAGFALLVAVASTWTAAAQEKKDLDKDQKDKKDELVKLGEVTGMLTGLGEDRTVTVKVTYRYMEPNASAFQNQANLARRQFDIMRNPNPFERQRQMAQLQVDIANNQRNLYTAKEVSKDVAFRPADGMKIRTNDPPLAFDDKGNPRKYTEKELKEMKGEGNLPGYQTDWDQLRTGQYVTITAARKKEAVGATKSKELDKEKELEKKLLDNSEKPLATMIVILKDGAPGK